MCEIEKKNNDRNCFGCSKMIACRVVAITRKFVDDPMLSKQGCSPLIHYLHRLANFCTQYQSISGAKENE